MTIAIWIFSAIMLVAAYVCMRHPQLLLSTYMNNKPLKNSKSYTNFTGKSIGLMAFFIPLHYYIGLCHQANTIAEVSLPLTIIWGIVGISLASQSIQNKSQSYFSKLFWAILISFVALSVAIYYMVQL